VQVIGADGFGLNGRWRQEKIQPLGIVKLPMSVEIGADYDHPKWPFWSKLDSGRSKDRQSREIAQKLVIGKNNVIAAQSGIAAVSKSVSVS